MEAPADLALFEVLRAKRMTPRQGPGRAALRHLPRHHAAAMAAERPRDLDAFARLPGVGGAKARPLCADIPRRHRGPCGEGFGVARGRLTPRCRRSIEQRLLERAT